MTKVLMSATCSDISVPADVAQISAFSVDSLAQLMVDAYEGTVDWEDGDDEHIAAAEIRATVEGDYGDFVSAASGVILNGDGQPASALFVSNFEGRATILFVYTSKQCAGRGLASSLIRNAAFELESLGINQVYLYVSDLNPARSVYEKLGFKAI
jgi:ribosomal protein S18 acetylase RimI-like enzyme